MRKEKFDLKTKIKTLICYAHVFDCPLSERELLYLCNNYKKNEVKKLKETKKTKPSATKTKKTKKVSKK